MRVCQIVRICADVGGHFQFQSETFESHTEKRSDPTHDQLSSVSTCADVSVCDHERAGEKERGWERKREPHKEKDLT